MKRGNQLESRCEHLLQAMQILLHKANPQNLSNAEVEKIVSCTELISLEPGVHVSMMPDVSKSQDVIDWSLPQGQAPGVVSTYLAKNF